MPASRVGDVCGLVGMSPRTVMDIYGHHSEEAMQEAANTTKKRCASGAHPRGHQRHLKAV